MLALGENEKSLANAVGAKRLQYKWSEQNASQDFSHDARLLQPLGKIA